jgi:3-oxoacyl-[acyl-carrier-protein] synthase II
VHARNSGGVVQGALAGSTDIGSFVIALTGALFGNHVSAPVSVFVSALVSAFVRLNSHRAHRALSCGCCGFCFVIYGKGVTVSRRRVVVTGLGLISPVGNNVADGWANLVAGKSGIANVTKFDASNFSTRFAGEVKGFNIEDYIAGKEARHMDTFIHYGVAAGIQAIKDSGLEITDANSERIGVNVGSGIGGLPMIEVTQTELLNRGPRRISPFFVPASIINMISGHLSIKFGLKGPNLAMVTACTTGLHCIGEASRLIEYGDCDVMIAGGAESTVSPLGIGGFAAARALSQRNDDPATASRPWDKDRDGFVLGEGAGVMVLEEYEHAKARGAKIYAEVGGYGMSGDAYHMTAPLEDGDGARRCMIAAMKNAGVNADSVNYLNAHGTSTPLGDLAETTGIKRAFGDHAKNMVVNSTKSMTGHLLGGAGGLESVFTVLAVHHQVSPPTINIFNQDPECDLDYCANTAREMKIDVALKNSFGFGGTNGTLVFKRA